jgi:hypothetical protein
MDVVEAALYGWLGKDMVPKLLGPTADYLGAGLKNITQRRMEAMGKIFESAVKRLGSKVEEPGVVPPKVLKEVLTEGSYATEALAIEYFGGVLASSRTSSGRDDRGARLAKMVANLSTYQLRAHYLIYSSIRAAYYSQTKTLAGHQDRRALGIYVPIDQFQEAMELTIEENTGELFLHIMHGLHTDGLIESNWVYAADDSLSKSVAGATGPGFVCSPSSLGAEMFIWAFGYGGKPVEIMLAPGFDFAVSGFPLGVQGVIPRSGAPAKAPTATSS